MTIKGRVRRPEGNRVGFQRLMTEVSLNHVGMILGLELSRLTRSNKDWNQLVDVCGVFQALLCDEDAIYDPLESNDRLRVESLAKRRDFYFRAPQTGRMIVSGVS